MGFTQGLLATLVADAAPPELRGTAFGMFNLLGGVALLAASVIAGALWDASGRREPSWAAPRSPSSPCRPARLARRLAGPGSDCGPASNRSGPSMSTNGAE